MNEFVKFFEEKELINAVGVDGWKNDKVYFVDEITDLVEEYMNSRTCGKCKWFDKKEKWCEWFAIIKDKNDKCPIGFKPKEK